MIKQRVRRERIIRELYDMGYEPIEYTYDDKAIYSSEVTKEIMDEAELRIQIRWLMKNRF